MIVNQPEIKCTCISQTFHYRSSPPLLPQPQKKNHYSFYFIATDGNGLREIVGKAKCTPRDSPTPQNKIKNPS